jgi:ABC-type cobalamin/Fe3+-siderophores transport system ATPase subunit
MSGQHKIDVTLTHYRCFHDTAPVTFSLEPGKTIALVGVNNAGKSALLRFFYEFKQVLSSCASGSWSGAGFIPDTVNEIISEPSDPNIGTRYGLGDVSDLYPNRSLSKPIQFAFDCNGTSCIFEISQISRHRSHSLRKIMRSSSGVTGVDADAIVQFQNTLYFGAHRNLVNEGAGGGAYFDLSVGTAFTNEWDYLKNGMDSQNAQNALKAEKLIADLLNWPSLSINASNDKKQIYLTKDGVSRFAISELGAGISELVLCIVTAAIKKPSWILIDEPESHLHPALQVKFVEALSSLSSHGVMFTTHSIGLARTCADSILVVAQDKEGRSTLRSFESVTNYSQLMGELSFSQFHELGFNKLLLCEGVTEVKTLRQILRHWKLDASVMLVPLGGTSLIDSKRQDELSEFTRFGVEVFVMIDSERDSAETSKADRNKFIVQCEKLFGEGHAMQTNYRATENYFTAEAISKAMRSDKYKPLEPFQNSNDLALFWGKNQNWRVAAEMIKGDWQKTDLGIFLERIAAS